MSEKKMNIYQKLQKMRVELQKKGLVKSGVNTFSKYEYFELSDFLPHINEIQEEYNTISLFEVEKEKATLAIVDCDEPDQKIIFNMPIAELVIKGANAIQNIGGLTTYCRRYLYMMAFEIAENDEFDRNESNEPKQQVIYVDEVKIKVLKERMEKKGVTDNQIFERYKVKRFEDLTVNDFKLACDALEKTPDKQEKKVDLDL